MKRFGIGCFRCVVHDKLTVVADYFRCPKFACAPAVFFCVKALFSLAPVNEIAAGPNVETFCTAGSVAVIGSLVQQDLGISDLGDIGDNRNVLPSVA